MLPEVALLEIFDFYVHDEFWGGLCNVWHNLVHVCRKWRNVVFGSPGRLDLRLYCTSRTPVKKTLGVWPPLPIVLTIGVYDGLHPDAEENIVAALEHNDRICQLKLTLFPFEKVLAAMQQPFPELKYLSLEFRQEFGRNLSLQPMPVPPPMPDGEIAPVDADSFLGGSAPPQLQRLGLFHIPCPGLPKLLFSATHLVHLTLYDIPDSGYISPEAMVASLSTLIRLQTLTIRFKSPRSRPDRRHPPRPTRTLLPVLTDFHFDGVSEYLEDIVAGIDAPLLDNLRITFFNQLLFDTPRLSQFISRIPKFKAYDEARVMTVTPFDSVVSVSTFDKKLDLTIRCRQLDWQLSSLAQVCSSSFPQTLISTVEHLYVEDEPYPPRGPEDVESSQWLELLHPFTAVKHLYVHPTLMPSIVPALQELVGERATEVLPMLQALFLGKFPSKPVQQAIEMFVAARNFAGHPIAVSRWQSNRHFYD